MNTVFSSWFVKVTLSKFAELFGVRFQPNSIVCKFILYKLSQISTETSMYL